MELSTPEVQQIVATLVYDGFLEEVGVAALLLLAAPVPLRACCADTVCVLACVRVCIC